MLPRAAAAALLGALLASSFQPQAGAIGALPISVQITAFIGPKPEGAVPEASWRVDVRGRAHEMHVMRLFVVRGDVAYFSIISALEPYPIAFTVYGDDAALAALTGATAGQEMEILGMLQLGPGARTLMVSTVQPVQTPSAALTPAPS